ncbi:protein S-acyltransferase [Malassezia nana]|uniref:Protein S-acyltransferase n=1 Tax=Malassezia nana TaxID=180528 RepID=A0AAF0EQB8_9BASI|nr:protein S-acyltransferase [Malassezia nana]
MARRAAARGGRLVPAALVGLFVYLYAVIGYGYYVCDVLTHDQRPRTVAWVVFLHILFVYCVGLHIRLSTPVTVYVDTITHHIQAPKMSLWKNLLLLRPLTLYTTKCAMLPTRMVERSAAGATGAKGTGRRLVCVIAAHAAFVASFLITTVLGYAMETDAKFDADITCPASMVAYLCLTITMPALFVLACGPLVPLAYVHGRLLWSIAHTVPGPASLFLTSPWSWLLGPLGRAIVALVLATKAVDRTVYRTGSIYSLTTPYPTVHVPLAVALTALLALVTLGLFLRSVYYLCTDRLTVEVQWEKYMRKLQADPSHLAQQQYEAMRPLCHRWDTASQRVVPIPIVSPVSFSFYHAQAILGLTLETKPVLRRKRE